MLRRNRDHVEREVMEALGQVDGDAPVSKVAPPPSGGDFGPHARNLLLRALIREGIVRGTLRR